MMLGEHDAANSAHETALALNPNLATAHYGLYGATLPSRLSDNVEVAVA